MKLLAIESSGAAASVAIWDDGVRAEFTLNDGKTHSEKLLPLIDAAFTALSLSAADLDAVAVSVGPGSFTGLRIGVATANAIAFAAGIPVVEVPTLDALAKSATAQDVVALLDARNARAYAAYYEKGEKIWGPEALDIAEIDKRVSKNAVAIGDITAKYKEVLTINLHETFPRASHVAELAAALHANGQVVRQAVPAYLVKPQAQRALEARLGTGDRGNALFVKSCAKTL